ncbi:MAG: hypothetical protein RLZZ165_959 [Bacteroidota bacterium]
MSFLKNLFPFLFKTKKGDKPTVGSRGSSASKSTSNEAQNGVSRGDAAKEKPVTIVAFGIVGRVRNAKGLRKGSKVYVRSILEDGERVRVRGTAPNGNKVTVTVSRRSLHEYQSEGVPEHVAKHYDNHSLFKEEHEAKVKAEALSKH